jgi:hypothetical protein
MTNEGGFFIRRSVLIKRSLFGQVVLVGHAVLIGLVKRSVLVKDGKSNYYRMANEDCLNTNDLSTKKGRLINKDRKSHKDRIANEDLLSNKDRLTNKDRLIHYRPTVAKQVAMNSHLQLKKRSPILSLRFSYKECFSVNIACNVCVQ